MTMWNYVFTAVVSFLCGYIVQLGWLKIRGRRILFPFISANSRNVTIGAIVLALVSLFTILNVQHTADQTEDCNRQFRAALKYNTDVNGEQRDMNDRATAISAERRTVLDEAFARIGQSLPERDSAGVYRAINEYTVSASRLAREYDQLISDRNALNNNRKPYPEPSCGL